MIGRTGIKIKIATTVEDVSGRHKPLGLENTIIYSKIKVRIDILTSHVLHLLNEVKLTKLVLLVDKC